MKLRASALILHSNGTIKPQHDLTLVPATQNLLEVIKLRRTHGSNDIKERHMPADVICLWSPRPDQEKHRCSTTPQ